MPNPYDAVIIVTVAALAFVYYHRRYTRPPRADRPFWRKAIGGTARFIAELFFSVMLVASISLSLGETNGLPKFVTPLLILAVYVAQRLVWMWTRQTAATPSIDAEALHV